MRIVVVGSVGIDFVSASPRLPDVGETVLASQELYVGPGGKGFNQATGAARLGGDVTFHTKTGGGDLGDKARGFLDAENLLGSSVLSSEKNNQVALILVDETGRNIISVAPGASADFAPSDIVDLDITQGDILLTQLEIPMATVATAARRARAVGATVVLNPAPAAPLPEELLPLVDIATPNETELALLTAMPTRDIDEVTSAAQRLLQAGTGTVIATMGDRGALLVTDTEVMAFSPPLVNAIDTTGAGDAFNAGLVVGLSRGFALPDAVELGNRAGAFCVTQLGVLDGLATQDQLDHMHTDWRAGRR